MHPILTVFLIAKYVAGLMKRIRIPNVASLDIAADELLRAIGRSRVVAFYGPMGAGKTTLIAHLCHRMGVTQTVNSPSFAIVNQYQIPSPEDKNRQNDETSPLCQVINLESVINHPTRPQQERVINHFDFYRIKNLQEAYDLGYQEYFFGQDYCFIEWPEMVEELLPEDCLRVKLEVVGDNERVIEI